VWYQDVHNNHYLADVIRRQVEFTALCDLIKQQAMRWKPDACLVEDKGNGMAYLQLMKDSAAAPCPLIPIEVGQASKEFRFDKVTPMIEAGNVYLPNTSSWLADYEKELVAFPMGKRDDQVDMTSQYLEWQRKKIKRGSRRMTGAGYKKHQ